MVTSKLKKVYHADYDYYTYYNYYTIPIGIAQLNAFSCAKKSEVYKATQTDPKPYK